MQAQTLPGGHAEDHGDLFSLEADINLDETGNDQGVDLDFSDLFNFPEMNASPAGSPKNADAHNQALSPTANAKPTDPRLPQKVNCFSAF